MAAGAAMAGVVLGATYPERHLALRDLRTAKAVALAAVQRVSKDQDAEGYDLIAAPPGSTTRRGPGEQRIWVYTAPNLRLRGGRGRGKGAAAGAKIPPAAPQDKRQKALVEAWARACPPAGKN